MTSKEQLIYGSIALLVDQEKPEGDKPSLQELAMLVDGRLPEVRTREVWTHIARSDETFRAWRIVAEAAGSRDIDHDAHERTRRSSRLAALRAFPRLFTRRPSRRVLAGTAVAASVLLAVVISHREQSDLTIHIDVALNDTSNLLAQADTGSLVLDSGMTNRGGNVLEEHLQISEDPLQRSFLNGLREGVTSTLAELHIQSQPISDWLEASQIAAQGCGEVAEKQACHEYETLGYDAGRIAVIVMADCSATSKYTGTQDNVWKDLQVTLNILQKEVSKMASLKDRAAAMESWVVRLNSAKSINDLREVICSAAPQLITTLKGQDQ